MIKGLVCSILSACCYGLLPILGKLGYAQGMAASEMLQYRFGLAALILFVWFALTNRPALRISRGALLKTALLGGLFYPLQSTCFLTAVQTIQASTTTLILYLYPALVTALGALIYRQRVGRRVVLSLVLVTGGCAVVFLDAFMRRADPVGVAWACGATVLFSCYLLLVQSILRGQRPLTLSLYVIFWAAVSFTVQRGLPDLAALDAARAGVALGLALVPTVLAVTLLYVAIEAVGSAYASIFSTMEPVTTVVAAALVLGEPIVPRQILGAVLIVAGIVVPNLELMRRKRRVEEP